MDYVNGIPAFTDENEPIGDVVTYSQELRTALTPDSGWQPLLITDGSFATAGPVGLEARYWHGQVFLRGAVASATFVGGFATIATLPPGIPPPSVTIQAHLGGKSTIPRAVEINDLGEIRAWYDQADTTRLYIAEMGPYLPD